EPMRQPVRAQHLELEPHHEDRGRIRGRGIRIGLAKDAIAASVVDAEIGAQSVWRPVELAVPRERHESGRRIGRHLGDRSWRDRTVRTGPGRSMRVPNHDALPGLFPAGYLPPAGGWLSSVARTSSTGTVACRSTSSAMLPMNQRRMPVRPCVAMTITSPGWQMATIALAAIPSTSWVETVYPLSASGPETSARYAVASWRSSSRALAIASYS